MLRRGNGFTLVELLVVLALISLLASLLLPALGTAQRRTQRIGCLHGCKQMGLGSQLYSNDDAQSAMTGTANFRDDDLNWLFPKYLNSLKLVICPATENLIRDMRRMPPEESGAARRSNLTEVPYEDRLHGNHFSLVDLQNNAPGKAAWPGTSYEVAGFFDSEVKTIRKTQSSMANYTLTAAAPNARYNFRGRIVGPADAWLIYDADDRDLRRGRLKATEDYPDPGDNHGTDGGNVAFGDGHAEWVPREQYIDSYIRGSDRPHPAGNLLY